MSPYFFFSLLLGGIYGALFHTWQGKAVKDLLYYIAASIVGFVIGQTAFQIIGWAIFKIGPLPIVEASLCAWIALFIARWLRI